MSSPRVSKVLPRLNELRDFDGTLGPSLTVGLLIGKPDLPMSEQTTQRSKGLLDPIERLSEVLFGLIMVLSFTGSLSAATAGREEVRTMLFGAIGCNLAWGIVDAVMYLITRLTERGRDILTLRAMRQAADPTEAHTHHC